MARFREERKEFPPFGVLYLAAVCEEAGLHGVRGTHLRPDWDGNWAKFHIHHNDERRWGSDQQWAEVEMPHTRLREFVESGWNSQG
ncbi:hypothetical protein ACFRAR_16290 [Kitasatospora sp. NPDC056651]|uniref:hypothetical protein n=1 Tax=Kitasatospora sp. NPDC056651 TaxID=3345892 RepID=UPI0036C9B87C